MENIPEGTQYDSQAPWNQDDDSVIIEVTISQTLSKTVKVLVRRDYDTWDILGAVKSQITLPSDNAKDWIEDDFEIIEE